MRFGADHISEELSRRCGSLQQIARITPMELGDGKERGVRCLDFRTGSGLNFTVVVDRGMDIAHAEYMGHNLCWLSANSIVAPEYYEPDGWGWIRSFFGGLLTTCGLVNVGIPDTWKNEPAGAHGRHSSTPAINVSHDAMWAAGEYHLIARGEMRETRPVHYNVLMRRSIHAIAGQTKFRIHDTVINEGFETVPHQILYHFNMGFPLVDRTSYLATPSQVVTPRDADAADGMEEFKFCHSPSPKYREKVYYHDLVACPDGRAWAGFINPDIDDGLGVYIKYDPRVLPILVQWKMLGEGLYVMGIEPSNSLGIGFERQQSLGVLRNLEPAEQIDYYLEVGILDGANEIAEFEEQIAAVAPAEPEFGPVVI